MFLLDLLDGWIFFSLKLMPAIQSYFSFTINQQTIFSVVTFHSSSSASSYQCACWLAVPFHSVARAAAASCCIRLRWAIDPYGVLMFLPRAAAASPLRRVGSSSSDPSRLPGRARSFHLRCCSIPKEATETNVPPNTQNYNSSRRSSYVRGHRVAYQPPPTQKSAFSIAILAS